MKTKLRLQNPAIFAVKDDLDLSPGVSRSTNDGAWFYFQHPLGEFVSILSVSDEDLTRLDSLIIVGGVMVFKSFDFPCESCLESSYVIRAPKVTVNCWLVHVSVFTHSLRIASLNFNSERISSVKSTIIIINQCIDFFSRKLI